MRGIKLEHVKKSFNGETIFDDLNITIPSGKFFTLLGPSGSGKTTLLRLVAGFETVEAGKIFLGDQDITDVPINERSINTVFQHYALFPHLNVFDNVAFGLKIKKLPKKVIEQRVTTMLKAMNLEKHIFKSIHQLSGGQQQRVSLARAIVNEPDVLLLDEPLAALDLKLREKMLLELIELQSSLHTTFIYVTHDQFEALTVADHMAIMNYNGEIEQVGSPKEIYEFPQTSFVAKFVGTTNIFRGILRNNGGETTIDVKGLGLFLVVIPKDKPWACDGCEVLMSIRPEKIEISKKMLQGFSNQLKGNVEMIVYHGRSTQYNIRLANDYLLRIFQQNAEHFPQEVIDYDDEVYLYWQKENAVLLEQ